MILPFAGLILFLTFVYFEPAIFFPVLGEVRAAFIISILTLIAAVMAGARPPKAIQNRLFIFLLFMAVISIYLSPIPYNENSSSALSHFYKAITLYFLVSMIIASKDYLIKFFYVTLGFGTVVSITTLLTVRAGIESLEGGNLYRMVNYFGGIGDDPNEFGALMVALFPLPIAMLEGEKSTYKKIIFILIALSFILCVTRTRSRGAFVGLLVILTFILWEKRKQAGVIILILSLFTFTYFHTHYGYWERIKTLQSMETIEAEQNAKVRLIANQQAIELIKRYPITGVGLGNFIQAKIYILKLIPIILESGEIRKYVLSSHNTFLGLGAELGLIGLLAFLIIIIASVKYCYLSERYFKTRDHLIVFHNISRGVRIGLVGLVVCFIFLSEEFNLILYQFIALAVSLKTLADREKNLQVATNA